MAEQYSLGEQIHVGSWPTFSVYRGGAKALGPEVNTAASLVYAVEGQTFVLAPCGVIGDAAHEVFCDDDAKKQRLLVDLGFSLIAIANQPRTRWATTRPDVFRSQVNRGANPRIVHSGIPEPGSEPEEFKLVAMDDA